MFLPFEVFFSEAHLKQSRRINVYVLIRQRLYKEKGENLKHNYTITAERPEITQARINTANFSDVSQLPLFT